MVTEEAIITPDVMEWARKRLLATHADIARRISKKTPPELVERWERGEQYPSMTQAEKIAKALYVPFGYLFLSSPPKDVLPINDFRTIGGSAPLVTGNLVDLLNSVVIKHDWYREFRQQEGEAAIPFVGRFKGKTNDPLAVADDIRRSLSITDQLRETCDTAEQFLLKLVRLAEGAGILVMRSDRVAEKRNRKIRVSVEGFRGFAISDPMAPLIFINSEDSKAAQLFTIGHELAHIWIGESGVSNEDVYVLLTPQNDVEIFCNAVSAELLVPSTTLRSLWFGHLSDGDNIDRVRAKFKVSSLVAIRRAFELSLISRNSYSEMYGAALAAIQAIRAKKPAKKGKGMRTLPGLMARNSATLTKSIIVAARQGRIPYREAGQMLNLRPSTIERLYDRI